jgi:hypothetical protein
VFGAAFNCNDERPVAQAFVKLTREKYGIRCPDHDVSQAYESAQLVKLALSRAKLGLTDASLKVDRVAIRDALTSIKDYQDWPRARSTSASSRRRNVATATVPASWSSTLRAVRTMRPR